MRVPTCAVLGQWIWFNVSPLVYSRTWPMVELVSLLSQSILDFHECESSGDRSKKTEFPYPGKSETPLTIKPDLGMTLLFDTMNSSSNQSPTRECPGRPFTLTSIPRTFIINQS